MKEDDHGGFGPAAVADALAREAAAQRAGVIVIGSRRRSLVREVVLGSKPERCASTVTDRRWSFPTQCEKDDRPTGA